MLLILFPVVLLEVLYLNPLLSSLNLTVANFIGNALSVAVLAFALVSLANRAFDWWLRPMSNDSPR